VVLVVVVVVMTMILTLKPDAFRITKTNSIQFDRTVIELMTSFSLAFGQSFYNISPPKIKHSICGAAYRLYECCL
jgi:hypothetical protein